MAALLLTIAFFPFALLAAWHVYPSLKPPKHKPLLFIFGGAFMSLFGLVAGGALRRNLKSGIIDFTSRSFGEIYATSAGEPVMYWTVAIILYSSAVFLTALGLAFFRLAFRSRE